jgi:predicted dehydrogenase
VIGVGVIGAGYWGPKHIRNFSEIAGSRVTMVADLSEPRLASIRASYPSISTTTDFQELLHHSDVDAVVIATPVSTHAALAEEALNAGKHVLVEKPLAASSAECERLIRAAEANGCVLMVGHTFLYNPAVLMLREMVQSGELGDIYCANAERLNLGLFQRDINVLWDLAPHDLSIFMYLLGTAPTAVSAHGTAHYLPSIEDVAYMQVTFPGKVHAGIHASWLDPNKVRRITLIGSRKMVVYDDVEAVDKIRVYDRGVDMPSEITNGMPSLSYRSGAISIPPVSGSEPLRLECEHFLECIRTGARPRSDGRQGLTVVQALEASERSLRLDGAKVPLAAQSRNAYHPARPVAAKRAAPAMAAAAGD